MTAFPWEAAMALGLGRLRIAPQSFWALTPREFAALAAGRRPAAAAPPGRTDVVALMRAFPDTAENIHGQ
ncbi:MAG: phage tail assembly chaperone [Phyllobacteriaceae bacterium]|nr:phage tail assembly chaperone [Phyllobacteriaceae bacterium]